MKRILFMIFLLTPLTLSAESLFMKDGSIIQGKILKETDAAVSLQTAGKEITIQRNQLLRVIYTDDYKQKKYIYLTSGEMVEGHIIVEDRTSYTVRRLLSSPAETVIQKNTINGIMATKLPEKIERKDPIIPASTTLPGTIHNLVLNIDIQIPTFRLIPSAGIAVGYAYNKKLAGDWLFLDLEVTGGLRIMLPVAMLTPMLRLYPELSVSVGLDFIPFLNLGIGLNAVYMIGFHAHSANVIPDLAGLESVFDQYKPLVWQRVGLDLSLVAIKHKGFGGKLGAQFLYDISMDEFVIGLYAKAFL